MIFVAVCLILLVFAGVLIVMSSLALAGREDEDNEMVEAQLRLMNTKSEPRGNQSATR